MRQKHHAIMISIYVSLVFGLNYGCELDLWSVACTIYELYTGKILFSGKSNNEMLKLMIDIKGRMNNKLVKKAAFRDKHFDESFNFMYIETDKVTQKVSIFCMACKLRGIWIQFCLSFSLYFYICY